MAQFRYIPDLLKTGAEFMRGTSKTPPAYRKHKRSGQAVVTLSGKDVYLGPHGTKASRIEYDRVIGEWLANGRQLPKSQATTTVADLVAVKPIGSIESRPWTMARPLWWNTNTQVVEPWLLTARNRKDPCPGQWF